MTDSWLKTAVSVATPVVLALLLQTGVFIWWAAGLDSRVNYIEKEMERRALLVERFITLEERVNVLLDAHDARLDRLELSTFGLQRTSTVPTKTPVPPSDKDAPRYAIVPTPMLRAGNDP